MAATVKKNSEPLPSGSEWAAAMQSSLKESGSAAAVPHTIEGPFMGLQARPQVAGQSRTATGIAALRICLLLGLSVLGLYQSDAQEQTRFSSLSGVLTDPLGNSVPGATISLIRRADLSRHQTQTNESGRFLFSRIDPGEYTATAEHIGFATIQKTFVISRVERKSLDLQFSNLTARNDSVLVTADVSDLGLFLPDPAQRIMIRNEILDANPGRPGMPVSIPGMPAESPAGGVKPPQYFIPGVAGDHGEPIALYFQVGSFLFPNNLPANAHGNGYADPNIIIPLAIDNVQTDGGAFNVREGNNSENAAIVFGIRERLEPLIRFTADSRDLNLVTGWSPVDPANKMWLGAEISYGNGFLKRLEHRKQYKGNFSKILEHNSHQLTIYGIGYYGFAYQPGLIPIDTNIPDDTIDKRQQEETSNGALIFNDVWHVTGRRQFQFSGFYRYYTLDVRPNFGAGLIRQSEHRNANSEDFIYAESFHKQFALLAGVNFRREAPSALDLDRADSNGVFQPVTANNLIMNFASPFVSADGALSPFVHYNLGYRQDEVRMGNQDIYRPQDSFSRSASIHSPKGTLALTPPPRLSFLPTVAYSYGQSFHVNDPRIGTSAVMGGSVVSKARSNQLVLNKEIAQTDLRITLEHVTTEQQLARISNDTGLQEDQGPGMLKSISITARHNFTHGFLQGLFARADARDRLTGEPTPEAPRLIWDLLGTVDNLPGGLVARAEYEHVGRKPLGEGFRAVPVREFRGAILRPFPKKGINLGVNVFFASGYGGQTVEGLALPGEQTATDRITGFPLKSYVTASVTYHFRKR